MNAEIVTVDSYLDAEERELLLSVEREFDRASKTPSDWARFRNFWWSIILPFYERRGVLRKEIVDLPLYRRCRDLDTRLMVAAGVARRSDYREDIKRVVKTYATRQDFCEAAGLSEEQYRHVIHGRDDVSLPALVQALGRLGYVLKLEPIEKA